MDLAVAPDDSWTAAMELWLGYAAGMVLVALGTLYTCAQPPRLLAAFPLPTCCMHAAPTLASASFQSTNAVLLWSRLRRYAAPNVDALTLWTVALTWLTSVSVVALVTPAPWCIRTALITRHTRRSLESSRRTTSTSRMLEEPALAGANRRVQCSGS